MTSSRSGSTVEFLLHFLAFLEFLSGSGSKVQGAQLPAAAGQSQQSAGIRGRGRRVLEFQKSPEMMKWVCLKMVSTPLYPMVLLIIIPMKNCYFIGNIPHFQTNPNISGEPWGTPEITSIKLDQIT